MVDNVADLELGLAEGLVFGLADEQTGKLQDVGIDGLANARGEGLGLLFLFGGQGVVAGHGAPRLGWIVLRTTPSAFCVQKIHQHCSCSPVARPGED